MTARDAGDAADPIDAADPVEGVAPPAPLRAATGAVGVRSPQSRPLRVRHFIAPAPVGGAESVVAAIASGLRENGHRVAVTATLSSEPGDHAFVRRLRSRDVPVDPLVVADRAYVREWRTVRTGLRREGPDVVHTHGSRADVVAGSAALSLGIPVVTTVHGFTDSTWRTRLYGLVQRASFRWFDGVVSVSRPLAEDLEAAGVDTDRIHVVPNALGDDEELLEPAEARRRLDVEPEAFHVGWVGRLSSEKGADVLLRAASRLGDLPLVVSIVGEGREGPALRELAGELGLDGRVRWHGEVPRARRLFPAFDVLALSSRREGTPVVLLEAMAAGVPVVATRVGGVPDVVSDEEALLVPPEDPGSLAEAVREIRRSPAEASRRARRAHRRLQDERSRDRWIRRYEEIYREAANRSSGRKHA